MGAIEPPRFGSKEEGNLGAALDRLRLDYYSQYSVMGGRRYRGGYVLDFYLPYTVPQSIAINVQGGYWHKTGAEEAFENATIENWCQDNDVRYVKIPAELLQDASAALKALQKENIQ